MRKCFKFNYLEIFFNNRKKCSAIVKFVIIIRNRLSQLEYLFFDLQHAPGIPKVLVGNRLHLAYKRQVAAKQAETYASRNNMSCFEISPLCDFNIRESFCELARMALHRNGMEHIWRSNKGAIKPLLYYYYNIND